MLQVPERTSFALGIRRASTAHESSHESALRALATSKTVALFAVSGVVVSIVVFVVDQSRPSDQPFHVWWRRFSWPMLLAWSMVGSYFMACIALAWQCLVICARPVPKTRQDDDAFQRVLGTQQACAQELRSKRHSRKEQNALDTSFEAWWSGSQSWWAQKAVDHDAL